jgi:hypothetical protein
MVIAAGSVKAQVNSTDQIQEKFQSTVTNWLNFFETNINWLSTAFLGFLKEVIRATYFTLGLTGFILWSTGLSRYTGRRLLIGAVALAFVSAIFL